jgi:HK97 family phage portal protein
MPGTSLAARVAGALMRPFRGQAKQAGNWLPISGGWVPSDWPLNFWQLGYNPIESGRSAIVTACVAAYAQTVAMCPGTHWRSLEDNGRERVANSALSRILKKPNSYQSISDFLLNMTSQLYTDGNAYALAYRNARFEVAELHLMNPWMSTPRCAVTGEVFYALAGNPVVANQIPAELLAMVPARDVLHIKLNTMRENPLKGESPLASALLDISTSNALVGQSLAYARNQGRPSGVITTDLNLSEDQTRQARQRWDEQTKGANAGGTPILTGGLKWEVANQNSRDAQLAELLQMSDARIAAIFRVPLALLNLMNGQAPQGSVENLMTFWVSSGLGFALNHIEEAFGRFFALAGQPDEYLELDTAALMRSNFRDRIEALARGVQGGIFSPNEARAREELPEAEDGDEPRVQQQVVPLSFGAKQQPAPTPAPSTPTPDPANDGDAPDDEGSADSTADVAARILGYADRAA